MHLRLCAFVCALRHRGKSRLESELLILTCSDQRPGSAGQARASFAEFEAALDAQRLQGLDNDVARRALRRTMMCRGGTAPIAVHALRTGGGRAQKVGANRAEPSGSSLLRFNPGAVQYVGKS